MFSQTGGHSRGGVQTGMDGTEIVNRTSPKQVCLQARGRASQAASAANQSGMRVRKVALSRSM